MKVELYGGGLLIVPETEFEGQYLVKNFSISILEKTTAFIKTGVTASDLKGLKVYRETKKEA